MAKKSGPDWSKLVVIAVVAFVVYKFGLPWFRENFRAKGSAPVALAGGSSSGGSSSSTGNTPEDCIADADDAASSWVGGLGGFTSSPIDQAAWDSFRSGVESQISNARSSCGACGTDACRKVQEALDALQGAVNDTDSAIRDNRPPPGHIIRVQEQVDGMLEQARGMK